MLIGPLKQDDSFVEIKTGKMYTILAGNIGEDGGDRTVLEILGTSVPAIVYYDQFDTAVTLVSTEAAFRENFRKPEDHE